MHRQFTIFEKGLLIVSLPLLAQAVFIGILMHARSEDLRAQQWNVHTKEVIAKVEETYRRLVEGFAGVRNLFVLRQPKANDPLLRELDQVPRGLAELREMVVDNLPQRARIDELAIETRAFVDMLESLERLVRAGQGETAAQQLDAAADALTALRPKVDAIREDELRLDRYRNDWMRRSNLWHFWILAGGGAAILATTLVLALVFFHGVIKRLESLRDNTHRFAEGKELRPPMPGGDEIADVDRAFHEMAASLLAQKQENEMFVYSVSHDLRSPLINLQGFSEELRLSCVDMQGLFDREGVPRGVVEQGRRLMKENIAESIRYIQVAVGRLARIIDALLRLSRAGRVQYQRQPLDVAAIVQKVVDALHDTVSAKKAKISVNPLPPATGDATAVEQIFANLLGNAVSYLDPERAGRIELGIVPATAGDGLAGRNVYYVKDNGLGIPAAYHDRVFTAFNRLHANVAQGEGIGLALIRRIVERHGGTIWMESSHGVGTTFFFTLPASATHVVQAQHEELVSSLDHRRGELSQWQPNRS